MKVMLSDFTGADRVYIVCGYTDLRRGIDGLAALVQQEFQLTHSATACFCSVAGAGIGSRHCTGRATVSCCSTSVWNPAASSGRERKARQEA